MRTEGGRAGRRAGGKWCVSWRELLARVRQVAGMPDYEAYVAHVLARHPDRAPLSEREFFDGFVRSRSGGVTRCC